MLPDDDRRWERRGDSAKATVCKCRSLDGTPGFGSPSLAGVGGGRGGRRAEGSSASAGGGRGGRTSVNSRDRMASGLGAD